MSRRLLEPSEFDIALSRDDFVDQMAEAFNEIVRGVFALDELLLHPQAALDFCKQVRARYGYTSLPEDVILRSIMQRRKNPGA